MNPQSQRLLGDFAFYYLLKRHSGFVRKTWHVLWESWAENQVTELVE